jgi:ParB family chromosome partitioning protein
VARKRTALGRGLAELLGEGGQAPQQTEPAAADETTAGTTAERTPIGWDAGPPSELGVVQSQSSGSGLLELPVQAIRPNPRQPRRSIDAEGLEELARSIGAAGLVQPVIVRRLPDGFELIAGERRWRAAQLAGFTVIPAILRQASDTESLEIALIENVVRQQLNAIDEAYALQVLRDDLGVTQESLASRVGKSRSAIANKIRLLELPVAVQEFLVAGELTEGHGRALLGLRSRGEQLRLARRAAREGLSVRSVEAEARRSAEKIEGRPPRKVAREEDALPRELLDEVRDRFYGLLEVLPTVRGGKGAGGRIEIAFRDLDDLRRLLDRLGP